jgi:predicted small lipoprotein YifL
MTFNKRFKNAFAAISLVALSACGLAQPEALSPEAQAQTTEAQRETIWDLLRNQDPDVKVSVNRFIWNASLEVLNFMPVESVDPFTGVIVMGYGTPPGGNRAYRATVYVKDPALEARSLVVALQGRNGRPVAASTQRAIEDAILTRARQLRIKDGRL